MQTILSRVQNSCNVHGCSDHEKAFIRKDLRVLEDYEFPDYGNSTVAAV